MALYRFLFAPVLLAVAVVAGSGDRAPRSVDAPAVVPARAEVAQVVPERVSAARPAARPARADRVRVRAVR